MSDLHNKGGCGRPSLLDALKQQAPSGVGAKDWPIFIERAAELQDAMRNGYARKQIYRAMVAVDGLSISYETFLRWTKQVSPAPTTEKRSSHQVSLKQCQPSHGKKAPSSKFAARLVDEKAKEDGTYRNRSFSWPPKDASNPKG